MKTLMGFNLHSSMVRLESKVNEILYGFKKRFTFQYG